MGVQRTAVVSHVTAWLQYAVLETEIFHHRYLKIDNSATRQYFLVKLCAYVTKYFRTKCSKFGWAPVICSVLSQWGDIMTNSLSSTWVESSNATHWASSSLSGAASIVPSITKPLSVFFWLYTVSYIIRIKLCCQPMQKQNSNHLFNVRIINTLFTFQRSGTVGMASVV